MQVSGQVAGVRLESNSDTGGHKGSAQAESSTRTKYAESL